MKLLAILLVSILKVITCGDAVLEIPQGRDSVRVGDRIRYSVRINDPNANCTYAFPDSIATNGDTLAIVNGGQLDTLYESKAKGRHKKGEKPAIKAIEWSIVVVPFEEIKYEMPQVDILQISRDGVLDTLRFAGQTFDVPRMQRDSTFVPDKLKDQITYPVTVGEVLSVAVPSLLGLALLAGLLVLTAIIVQRKRGKGKVRKDPPYVVALSTLDKYRGKEMWEPAKQKLFYSAVTDILRRYIDDSFQIDAPEMTTEEIFAALENDSRIPADVREELLSVFRTADFVKFAKYTATDDDCAKALPTAVRFVTNTYVVEVEEENK